MKPEIVATGSAPAAIGPYSQAVKAGGMLYCSGQIALDPATMQMVGATAAEQAERVLQNLEAVLKAGGSSFDKVVRTTIYLVSMADFAAVNEVMASFLQEPYPARACVQVAALPRGADIEVEAMRDVEMP